MSTDLRLLETYPNRIAAETVRGRLETEGIRVVLDDGTQPAQLGDVAMAGWTHVGLLVAAEDLERARRVIAEAEARAEAGDDETA